MAYITLITRYSARYPIQSVLTYDKKFRQRIEVLPDTPWGVVDSEIFDEYLAGRILPATSSASGTTSTRTDLACRKLDESRKCRSVL